jgi:hypothetical protein
MAGTSDKDKMKETVLIYVTGTRKDLNEYAAVDDDREWEVM